MKKTIFLSIISIACWCFVGSNNAFAFDATTEGSYQVAKAIFLPDLDGSELANPDAPNVDNCKEYTLKSCPKGGLCSRCPFNGLLFKLESCNGDEAYKKVNDTCVKMTCPELNSAYKTSVPSGQICTAFTEKTLNCYKNCRAVNCSGYTVSCSTKPDNATSLGKCPDCNSSASNCGTNVCKVTGCATDYKINSGATGCLLKDDTCPSGYYKTCDTGTQGDPKYTERGSACYQCKPKSCDIWAWFYNTDGVFNVSPDQCAIMLYGQYNTTNIPVSGISVERVAVTYPSGSTFNGGPLTTKRIDVGSMGGGMDTTVTFNMEVTVNGDIYIRGNSKLVFNKGIKGNYTCHVHDSANYPVIPCPFNTSGGSSSSGSSSGGISSGGGSSLFKCAAGQRQTTCSGMKCCCPAGATCNGPGARCLCEAIR